MPTVKPTIPERVETPAPTVKPKVPEPKFPSVEVPQGGASAGAKEPTLDLPGGSGTKLPPLDVTGGTAAIPVPAPSAEVLIPPTGAATPKNADALPPLSLPPDSPVAPTKPVEAKSSPLRAAAVLKVQVFPAAGVPVIGALRKVGFYNHTARDIALTIEGQSVKLPAKSYLFAQLPSTFSWVCAGKSFVKETIPDDATGLDVLIRE